MSTGALPTFGLANRFQLKIAGTSLGNWSKCSGLQVDFAAEEYAELGNNFFTHYLPKGAKFSHITLERACDPQQTSELQQWLATQVVAPQRQSGGSIALLDTGTTPVYTWELQSVFPVKWVGPTFDAKSNEVALEQLVIAHEGFL